MPLAFIAWQGSVAGNEHNSQTNETADAAAEDTSTMGKQSSTEASSESQSSVSVESRTTAGQSVTRSSHHTSVSSSADGSTKVEINGKRVHVPNGGEFHKEFTDKHGSTTQINVSSDNEGSSSNSSSTLNIQINSESTDM